jgi:hypothetical protein
MTERPGIHPDQLIRGVGLTRRVVTIGAGLLGACGSVLIAALWLTEPAPLPARTAIAFAVLIPLGLAWAVRAGLAVARWPLFAVDRVIAAALAVGASVALTGGLVQLALTRGSASILLAGAGVGLATMVTSAVMLRRATVARSALRATRRRLEGDLTGAGQPTGGNSPRRPLPIGPLALALRHRHDGTNRRGIVVLMIVLAAALFVGLGLLLAVGRLSGW